MYGTSSSGKMSIGANSYSGFVLVIDNNSRIGADLNELLKKTITLSIYELSTSHQRSSYLFVFPYETKDAAKEFMEKLKGLFKVQFGETCHELASQAQNIHNFFLQPS